MRSSICEKLKTKLYIRSRTLQVGNITENSLCIQSWAQKSEMPPPPFPPSPLPSPPTFLSTHYKYYLF